MTPKEIVTINGVLAGPIMSVVGLFVLLYGSELLHLPAELMGEGFIVLFLFPLLVGFLSSFLLFKTKYTTKEAAGYAAASMCLALVVLFMLLVQVN